MHKSKRGIRLAALKTSKHLDCHKQVIGEACHDDQKYQFADDQFFDEGSALGLVFLIFWAVLLIFAHSLFRWLFARLRLACCNLA